jgi:hypothetical protein
MHSFTPPGHWQSLLDKNFDGSTDLLETIVQRKVAVFKKKGSVLQNKASYITD